MKKTFLFTLCALLMFTFSSYGGFKISKDNFIQQYNGDHFKQRLYCFDENGNKIWVNYSYSDLLIIHFIDSKKTKELQLGSIIIENEKIKGRTQGSWDSRKLEIPFSEIDFFEINNSIHHIPYYNIDSTCGIISQKNDSLKKDYAEQNHFKWILVSKHNPKDSITIIENTCFNLEFSDGLKTQTGIIFKLTKDSIYTSTAYSKSVAQFEKLDFKEVAYSKNDLAKIIVLANGGFNTKKYLVENYTLYQEIDTTVSPPYFFSLDRRMGKIKFHRFWYTQRGFAQIFEDNGRVTWSNG